MDQYILPVAQKVLQHRTYLSMIGASRGSQMFRRLYADTDGKAVDILDDGRLSCAFFVSSILKHFDLVQTPHATIGGLIRDMEASGWYRGGAYAGAVLVWEPSPQAGGEVHAHVGFWWDDLLAISHSDKEGTPVLHSNAPGFPHRRITSIYRHSFLEER